MSTKTDLSNFDLAPKVTTGNHFRASPSQSQRPKINALSQLSCRDLKTATRGINGCSTGLAVHASTVTGLAVPTTRNLVAPITSVNNSVVVDNATGCYQRWNSALAAKNLFAVEAGPDIRAARIPSHS